MIETTKLITVSDNKKPFKGSEFKHWDTFVANFFENHPEYKVEVTANNKQKRKKKQ